MAILTQPNQIYSVLDLGYDRLLNHEAVKVKEEEITPVLKHILTTALTPQNVVPEPPNNYTPVLRSTDNNTSLGNGTIRGHYIRLGLFIYFVAELRLGSSTNTGTGGLLLSLPLTAHSKTDQFVDASYLNLGITEYSGQGQIFGSSSEIQLVTNNQPRLLVSATVPFTFGDGDRITVSGCYIPVG